MRTEPADLELAIPQALAYMAANPQPEQVLYGMVTNGSSYLFVKTLSKQYAVSEVMGLKIQDGKMSLEDLPPELRSLGAMHTENFLCIYKDELRQLNYRE